jgi:site-specific recombinase XerC
MDLATASAELLRDAEGRLGRAELRELRGALAHVDSELGTVALGELRPDDVRRLIDELGRAGLPPARVRSIVAALRSVYAYAIDRGLVRSSPVVGVAADDPAPAPPSEAPTPTEALLALGNFAVALVVRTIVVAFMLVAAGLVLALL